MNRNGQLKISKSLKKAENGPFGKNLFPITATLALYISESCKNKECCAKVRFEFFEMHTNSLDPYLIIIVAW